MVKSASKRMGHPPKWRHMTSRVAWGKERRLGVAALVAMIAGFVMLIWVNTFRSVCAPPVRPLSWALILISFASPIALLWAAIKDKWWWAIGLLPAIALLLGVLGTFEGC